VRLTALDWTGGQHVQVGHVELFNAVRLLMLLVHLSQLLLRVGHRRIRVNFLLPFLHHLKLDIDHLNDAVEDHVVVELKFLVKIVLFFELFKLLGCSLQFVEEAL